MGVGKREREGGKEEGERTCGSHGAGQWEMEAHAANRLSGLPSPWTGSRSRRTRAPPPPHQPQAP